MCRELILTLLLFGGFTNLISKEIKNNSVDSLSWSGRSQKEVTTFILVNPKQVNQLETTIRQFISRLAEPIDQPIILRSSAGQNDVPKTIQEVGKHIRKKVMGFAKSCGLDSTFACYKQSSKNIATSKDWLDESLLQGSLMICDMSNIIEETLSSIIWYLNQRNITSPENKQDTSRTAGFRFLGAINDLTEYSESISYCLSQMSAKRKSGTLDIRRVFLNIATKPPKVALRSLRSSFDNILFDSKNSSKGYMRGDRLHMFICLSLTNNSNAGYDECIRELQQLGKCVNAKRRSDKKITEKIDPWLRTIPHLCDCKIHRDNNGKACVSCNTAQKIPKQFKKKVQYIYERILNRKLSKRSPLYQMANKHVSRTLSRTTWGKQFVNELCQYFAIYEDGCRKAEKLSRMASNNKKAAAKYKQVSRALVQYRKGVFYKVFGALKDISKCAHDFEQFLVNGIKDILNEAWQGHVKILSTMFGWMIKLLGFYGSESTNVVETELVFSSTTPSAIAESDESLVSESAESSERYSKNNGLQQTVPSNKNDIMKETDIAMKKLITSMNRVSRFRSRNNNSVLAHLANNILLVSMFMETIGLVSALYCMEHTKHKNSATVVSSEMSNYRNSEPVGRKSRSPMTFDYQIHNEFASEEHFTVTITNFDNITDDYDDNYWMLSEELPETSTYSMFFNIKMDSGNNMNVNNTFT